MAKVKTRRKPPKRALKRQEKKDEKEKRKTVLKETSFNFTNQYRNTNFTDFHQLILSIETC
jgi:hypothetical protein